ncbi:hypothetical protein [Clostridium sp. KNHs205]|jgi:hypothetical protein|uniref:hypothetical protein n=1 Tax=Clostridium sp. KNHs205 TaxID=1449050 RepID=UPI000AA11F9E|nr:hypothetical protein [Clostridium sp. KNHs205]
MAVVKDYYDGNTHIIIKDDFIVSPEEQKKILKRCGAIAARQYYSGVKERLSDDKTA